MCRRTVLLTGIPAIADQDSLQDLLEIHFQKTSNGGGEVDAIIYNPLGQHTLAVFDEDSPTEAQRQWNVPAVSLTTGSVFSGAARGRQGPDSTMDGISAALPVGENFSYLIIMYGDVCLGYCTSHITILFSFIVWNLSGLRASWLILWRYNMTIFLSVLHFFSQW